MALAPGTRLGGYEILALIGQGGMGEVYRAHDTRLGRDVAIKVLPSEVATDADRLARFEREAQVLASLNHPNIAHIHGIEDSIGVPALVMELVDGPTLADRIAKGPIPLDEALPIAKQIAEALEAAHEQGIIHRDLKPANIKVRLDGTVKVLDFGLAKAFEPVGSAVGHPTMSPTLSIHATQAGIILGTAAYMAPEQARGKVVDKRADIWAFGCVLFEMLTGRAPFPGDDTSQVLARVIERDPDWTLLSPATPPAARRLLMRCLKKDPKDRLQAIGDARLEIDELLSGSRLVGAETVASVVPAGPPRRGLSLVAFALLVSGVMIGGAIWLAARPPAARVTRTTIATTGDAAFAFSSFERDLTITPDGSRVVYVGNRGTQLFVRALDALEPVAIATGATLRSPFVSPDGQWVGFVENLTALKKVAIAGGPALPIATLNGVSRGATWLPDDTIVVATLNATTGLLRVSANGGAPEVLTRPDHTRGEVNHLWPAALPGGRVVLFTITAREGLDAAQVAAFDLQMHATTVLVRGGSDARYVGSGHLVYAAGGTLRAVPFDRGRLAVHGLAVPLVPHGMVAPTGAAEVAASADGTLVYAEALGDRAAPSLSLVWVDRTGREQALPTPPRPYLYPRLSPDGTRVAVFAVDQELDLWVWDLRRATLTRLTAEPGVDRDPIWTPDNARLIFGSDRAGGQLNLWWQAADGTGAAERLTTSEHRQIPTGVTPDGRTVLFDEQTDSTGIDILQLPLGGDHRPTVLLQTQFNERNGTVSPDGHWLAYQSDASGRFEIYVRPYPTVEAGQWQVSATGGTRPLWSRTGTELFFVGPDNAVMRVSVEAKGPTWNAGPPVKLFAGPYVFNSGNPERTYDVAADGRFLMVKTAEVSGSAAPPQIVLIQHADQALARLAPTP